MRAPLDEITVVATFEPGQYATINALVSDPRKPADRDYLACFQSRKYGWWCECRPRSVLMCRYPGDDICDHLKALSVLIVRTGITGKVTA